MQLSIEQSKREQTRSGVYMGGIGSGGFEVRPDGTFCRCRIFNDWNTEPPFEGYFLYTHKNKTHVLRLDDLVEPHTVAQGVKSIRYQGEFPKVKLSYPGLPVTIEFLSFFIPGDVKNSSLPGITCRVKGKGKLCFFLPACNRKPKVEGQNIFLKTEAGELGLHSSSGKIFCTDHERETYNAFIVEGKIPQSRPYTISKGRFYGGVFWEGGFNDEMILGWHAPDMRDMENNFMGHSYANYFRSCREVLSYMVKRKKALRAKTQDFYDKVYHSRLPLYLKDSYTAQLSSFVKGSWLTKRGEFAVWEGSSCSCGLQTTDVSYYGSWLYADLFPELEKRSIKLTAKHQNKDGWIPHSIPGTFTRIDSYSRKDVNMQFVLMVYRNYYLWKDREFLKQTYPKLKKAISKVYALDNDGDLIPDIVGTEQTFDLWAWKGCAIYMAGLWLATLRVGVEAGRLMKDTVFSNKCEADFQIVRDNIVKKLWNGEYFILWRHGRNKDEGCLLDALSGDWYSYLSGLGHILPEKMIKSHLKACLKYNRKKVDVNYMKAYSTPGEEGWCYINGGYKNNKTYGYQQYEPWTGIEYSFAVHLYIMGMKKQALEVIKDVYDRKAACGMIWNHIECGGDYMRPMVVGVFYDMLAEDRLKTGMKPSCRRRLERDR